MTSKPIICFGQQPCGFFPKRFLAAKISTAKKIQSEIGGRIVFFYHDSDADYRETITIMTDRQTGAEVRLNFTQENKLQKKFSPLYLKRIPSGWKEEILKQLPRFVLPSPSGRGVGGEGLIDILKSTDQHLVSDFCLEMYQKMGLLDGIEVLRSSDKNFREKADDLAGEYFADVEYQGEIVRSKIELPLTPSLKKEGEAPDYAQASSGKPRLSAEQPSKTPPLFSKEREGVSSEQLVGVLHEGGDQFIRFPIKQLIQKSQISAGRDQRFAWMQSVINCTHYIYGDGEKEYLDTKPFSDIKFIDREKIDRPNYAWLG